MVEVTTNLAVASLIFSVLSFITVAFGLIMWQFPDFANTIRGITNIQSSGTTQPGFLSSLSFLAVIGGALSPDISLLVGFVSDIMNGSFRYSVTSIVGIIAVILHWIVGKFVFGYNASTVFAPVSTPIQTAVDVGVGSDRSQGKGLAMSLRSRPVRPVSPFSLGTPAQRGRTLTGGASYIQEKFNPCTIRGLGMFELTNSPMGIAALSAIFMVYVLDMTTKRSTLQIGTYLGFSTLIFALNLYAYKEAKCVEDTSVLGLIRGIALPAVVGLATGGIAYGTMKTSYPSFLPLDAEAFDSGTPGKPHAKCGQPSENEFVCDAYKDGKKISSAVVS